MNSPIETLNHWGDSFFNFAATMFWQSSLLIVMLFALEFLFRNKIRASIRYALWLVVLLKLILPPALALPTSPVWWLHFSPAKTQAPAIVIRDAQTIPIFPQQTLPVLNPAHSTLSPPAWMFIAASMISASLFVWLLVRWSQVNRNVRRAAGSEKLNAILDEARRLAGSRLKIKIKLTEDSMSPAVCGLMRPAILLPRSLAEKIPPDQLRAVLLHEIIHLRRGDVWVNCLQTLLQIFYWWNPLLWLANARIRRVREEAVDDAVMLALAGDSDAYATTLLEVAKFAFNRPLASLGLIGILESRSALRQRIERLLNFSAPRKAGLTVASFLGIFIFGAVALPMGEGPGSLNQPNSSANVISSQSAATQTKLPQILIMTRFYQMRAADFEKTVSGLKFNRGKSNDDSFWSIISPEEISPVFENLKSSGHQPILAPRVVTISGQAAEMSMGNATNRVEFSCLPIVKDGQVNLTLLGKLVGFGENNFVTNQFRARASIENDGGMVIDLRNPNEASGSNFVAIIGVRIVTNPIVRELARPTSQIHIKTRFFEVPKGIAIDLTNLETLRAQAGVKELAEPEVITISGRQIQMRATQIITVITNVAYEKNPTNKGSITFQTGQVETGPVFDVIPTILADGRTIDLRAIASVTEFLGYANFPTNKYIKEVDVHLPVVLPRFSTQQSTSHLKLQDGQTLMMNLSPVRDFQSLNKKISEVPEVARAFQSEPDKSKTEKELIVFVTATLVDAMGNRIYPDN
jgi:bla regulator protein BlaR1